MRLVHIPYYPSPPICIVFSHAPYILIFAADPGGMSGEAAAEPSAVADAYSKLLLDSVPKAELLRVTQLQAEMCGLRTSLRK